MWTSKPMSRKTIELSANATYSQNDSTATRVDGAHPGRAPVVAAEHAGDDRRDHARAVEVLGERRTSRTPRSW